MQQHEGDNKPAAASNQEDVLHGSQRGGKGVDMIHPAFIDQVRTIMKMDTVIYSLEDGRFAPPGILIAAHVTIGDRTLTVKASEVSKAITDLAGAPRHGVEVNIAIRFEFMMEADFAALPQYH